MLISLHDAARRLGVHISTIRAWVRDGQIPAYRVGQRFTRVNWDEVLAHLATEKNTNHPMAAKTPQGPAK